MASNSTIIKITLVHCLVCFLFSSNAQKFFEKDFRDLQKMRNNYGNAVADYDLDGDLDVFIVAFDSYDPKLPETWSRLLRNSGNGGFEDVTEEAGFRIQYVSSVTQDNKIGVSWGDYDNDGYPDLFLSHIARTELYRNLGNGKFKDVSTASRIDRCVECVNNSALWWDYDKDGYLDLYISDGRSSNRLYRNNGDGTFANVTAATGLGDAGSTWSSLPIDANEDGWMDLMVLNDFGQSNFYESIDGHSFVDKTKAYQFENPGDAMGASLGDCNLDGHLDIYITNVSEFQPNPLYIGSGSGIFNNEAAENGVEEGHWAWGTHFFDADHDGDEDLYIVNGWFGLHYKNKFFKNLHVEGKVGFVDWSMQSSTDGFANGMSTEVFDYDNDGDLDILVSNTNDAPDFYENIGAGGRNWLQVILEGKESNRNAFGATVSLWVGDRLLRRFHHGSGIMTQSVKPVHFGLGSVSMVDSIAINWPNGARELYDAIEPNQKIRIVENTGIFEGETVISTTTEIFTEDNHILVYPNPFDKLINIKFHCIQQGDVVWTLYDLKGRELLGGKALLLTQDELVLDLSTVLLNEATYFISLSIDGKQHVQKIAKF